MVISKIAITLKKKSFCKRIFKKNIPIYFIIDNQKIIFMTPFIEKTYISLDLKKKLLQKGEYLSKNKICKVSYLTDDYQKLIESYS